PCGPRRCTTPSFSVFGEEIGVRADPERRLRVEDTSGREMLIGCGAALFNVRITLRAMDYLPLVRLLPDPDRPNLLATVRPGTLVAADEHARLMHAEIERRRTHRGAFADIPLSEEFLDALGREASEEGARLVPIGSQAAVEVLAALTCAAQRVQEQDQPFALEVLRWSRPPGSTRRDGVPAGAYPLEPGRTDPEFLQRDYARGQPWGYGRRPEDPEAASAGVVAVLTTAGDVREHWLAAGQALQRVLLRASAHGVSAAFHTQALEFSHLREFLRQELLSGEHPQMIMRLGVTLEVPEGARRPPEVIEEQ
ncbi:Acg family FMN-binding oxidoreductase, partial [Sphaerimonospora mesophila]|uniref:Acg family FMN-binding oxidoreductase n=1 Tax=Sphaerimonospora mesophila TaxID=37483 RepID=UPI000AC940C3